MQGSRTESAELRRLRTELDRLFNQVTRQGSWPSLYGQSVFHPPTDVYETDDSLWVKVEVAGMNIDHFRIALIDRTLVVAGVRRDTTPKRGYHQMEIGWGPFQTEVAVNLPVQAEDIEAEYADGFLTIRVPKARRRHIPIQERDEE